MPAVHRVTSPTGMEYELAKMRTPPTYLPVYHYRKVGAIGWRSLHVDTLAEARECINEYRKRPRVAGKRSEGDNFARADAPYRPPEYDPIPENGEPPETREF